MDWDLSTVDFAVPGTYKIKGNVHQEHFEFPIAFYRADPCVAKWKNKYYFIATNDADDNHTLYIREADTIPGAGKCRRKTDFGFHDLPSCWKSALGTGVS